MCEDGAVLLLRAKDPGEAVICGAITCREIYDVDKPANRDLFGRNALGRFSVADPPTANPLNLSLRSVKRYGRHQHKSITL